MGANLSVLKSNSNNRETFLLLKKPLIHLKENFCAFKALCDNFFLDITQFQTIFGMMDNSFAIWDNDKNGLIDAFELFSGLIICSDAKMEDKVRFLFEIFDLNEVDFLQMMDIEFMLYSIMTSIFKIFGIKKEVDVVELANTIGIYFIDKDQVIKMTALMKFVNEFEPVQEFLKLLSGNVTVIPNRTK